MIRTILDKDLRSWEVYATPGDFGLPAPARIAFRCTSDGLPRPRAADFQGDKSDAEQAVRTLPQEALLGLLERAVELA